MDNIDARLSAKPAFSSIFSLSSIRGNGPSLLSLWRGNYSFYNVKIDSALRRSSDDVSRPSDLLLCRCKNAFNCGFKCETGISERHRTRRPTLHAVYKRTIQSAVPYLLSFNSMYLATFFRHITPYYSTGVKMKIHFKMSRSIILYGYEISEL